MVAAPYLPGAYQDFVRMVVPELQKRERSSTKIMARIRCDAISVCRDRKARRRIRRAPIEDFRNRYATDYLRISGTLRHLFTPPR